MEYLLSPQLKYVIYILIANATMQLASYRTAGNFKGSDFCG